MLIPGGPFENSSIPEIQTPVSLSAHGGLPALEIPEAFNQRKRQPVHRNLIPPLSGIGYFRGATSTVGHLSRSIATFHFAGPPPFSVIPISLHALCHLSIWISITPKSTIQDYRYPLNNAVVRLQIPGCKPAHYQAVQEVERELPGGVVAARQIEHFMRQIELPKAVQNLPRVHRKRSEERRVG